jgi:hypothetical protein
MDVADSALDVDALAEARALLARPVERERLWPTLAAAAFAAVSALALATAMVMAPPVVTTHLSAEQLGR